MTFRLTIPNDQHRISMGGGCINDEMTSTMTSSQNRNETHFGWRTAGRLDILSTYCFLVLVSKDAENG